MHAIRKRPPRASTTHAYLASTLCTPQALVVSLGFDTLGTDPEIVPGAGMALAPPDFAAMGALFRGAAAAVGMPLLYIQEGGYDLEGIGQAAGYMFGVRDPA